MKREALKPRQWPHGLSAYRLQIEGRPDRVELMTKEIKKQRNSFREDFDYQGRWQHDPYAEEEELTAWPAEVAEDRPIKKPKLQKKFESWRDAAVAGIDLQISKHRPGKQAYAVRRTTGEFPIACVVADSRTEAMDLFIAECQNLVKAVLRLKVAYYTPDRKNLGRKNYVWTLDDLLRIFGSDLPFKVESFESYWRRRRHWIRQQKQTAIEHKELDMSKKDKKKSKKSAEAKEPKEETAKSERPNWNGHAMTAILRHCGEKGYSKKQARAIMEHCGMEPADATMHIQMGRGRKGEAPVAMSKALTKELAEIAKTVPDDKKEKKSSKKGGKSGKSSKNKKAAKVKESDDDASAEDASEEADEAEADEDAEVEEIEEDADDDD